MSLNNIEEYNNIVEEYANYSIDWEYFNNKTIMISGATGMVGKCLIDILMHKNFTDNLNCHVIALGRNIEKAVERFDTYFDDKNFTFLKVDINKPLDDFLDKYNIDYILHAASSTHPLQYANDPIGTITANVIGTNNLLDCASKKNVKRFLFTSSVEVYGENRKDVDKFDEKYLGYIDCNTLRAGYPESKRTGESLCQAYIKQKNVDVVIARLSRIFGPTMLMSDSKASSQFIRNRVNDEDIVLKSEGLQHYSYSYVFDAVFGLLLCFTKGKCGEAYNIADSKFDVRLRDFATKCAESNGKSVIFDLPDATEKAGYSTATKALLDSSKIVELGYYVQKDFSERIDETINILKKEIIKNKTKS